MAFLFLVFFVIWLPEFYGLPVFGLHNPINYKRSNGLGHPFCLQLARSHFISISRSPDFFLSKILFAMWRPLMSFIWDKLSVFQGVCPKDFSAISCHQENHLLLKLLQLPRLQFTLCQHLCSLLLIIMVEKNLSIFGSRGLQARGGLFITSPSSSSSSFTRLCSTKPSKLSRLRGVPRFLSTFCGSSMSPLFTLVGPPMSFVSFVTFVTFVYFGWSCQHPCLLLPNPDLGEKLSLYLLKPTPVFKEITIFTQFGFRLTRGVLVYCADLASCRPVCSVFPC